MKRALYLAAVLALLTLLVAARQWRRGPLQTSMQEQPNTEPHKPSTVREFSLQPVAQASFRWLLDSRSSLEASSVGWHFGGVFLDVHN